MEISNYLANYLANMHKKLGYNEFHKLCEDIINQKEVEGLDQYSRELLAIELEKMIMMCVEKNRLATDHKSYFKTLELTQPLIYNYAYILIAYIKLFIVNRDSLRTNKDLEVVENYYNAVIYEKSKKLENKMMTVPGGKRVCLGDVGISIDKLMNRPVSYDVGSIVNKTNKKAKKAAAIGAIVTSIALATLAKGIKDLDPVREDKKTETTSEIQDPDEVIKSLQELDILGMGYNFLSEEETEDYKKAADEVIDEQYEEYNNHNQKVFVGYDIDVGNIDQNYEIFLKQRFLYELCKKEGVDFNRAMSIWHRESNGNFNNNGIVSSTDDYGEMQINKCNLKVINEEFGYTADEIQNDWMKNMIASVYLMKGISKKYTEDQNREFFGCYNGWVDWGKSKMAREYSEAALKLFEEVYNKTDEELLAPYEVYEEKMEGTHGKLL